MNYRETTVDVTSDYFPDDNAMHEYLGNHLVQAVVCCKWVEDTHEDHHPHGSVATTFQRLMSWDLVAIRFNGELLVQRNTPADFPISKIVELSATDAFRTELERGTR